MSRQRDERVDAVVVGAGSAALTAALACHEGGASRIVVLEKAPEEEFGGNPRFSSSGFRWVQSGPEEVRPFLPDVPEHEFSRMQFRPYTEADFHGHISRATKGQVDPDLQDALVGDSNEAVHWLRQQGLEWAPLVGPGKDRHVEIDGKYHFEPGYSIHPKDGGLGQLKQLRDLALARGVDIRYDSSACALPGSLAGVEGVRVADPHGTYTLTAPIVFLCAGGFQANAEMRARYLGPNADLMRVRGSKHNTGEVLRMALELGASPAGHWQMGHSSVVDANSPRSGIRSQEFNRYSYLYGISVNTLGQRYMDEGSNLRMLTYARMGWLALSQPDGIVWQIFDQKIIGAKIMRRAYEHAPVREEADTITELASQIGVNEVALQHTVDEFNAACREDVPFDPTRPDGKSTVGLALQKSNWAIPIDKPPYVAFPVTAGITFTFGGVAINRDAQVIGVHGKPIDGLYASGDIVGFFYHGYVGSTGQTRNAVFALRGARHATG